jgi:hypothetical protein
MCHTCYNRHIETKGRDNPDKYQICKKCHQYGYHRGADNEMCRSVFSFAFILYVCGVVINELIYKSKIFYINFFKNLVFS